ncbi:GntR family transcriptional regulator [Kribbella sp. CA-245084]|uniref:GntR family transcriptional regulator n=1 Tax=Kribbella sp. CA-245084 TaxID=3239940 RepID=UPI003D91C0A3
MIRTGMAGQEYVRDAVREDIASGRLAPGQRLVEADLAEQYGVVRSGVRAALLDLSAEGLVERIPQRGSRVRTLSLEEAIEVTEARMVLESLCAAKAAARITERGIVDLRALGDRMAAAVADGDDLGYAELDDALHRLIRELSGQQTATTIIERLRVLNIRHHFRMTRLPRRAQTSLEAHLRIINAIADRDPDAAGAAMTEHLSDVIDHLAAAKHS